MAPFSRGPIQKGRGGKRHGRGHKSNNQSQRSRTNGFSSSRLTDAEVREAQHTPDFPGNGRVAIEESHVSSDEESVHDDIRNANPYNSLLQSLTIESIHGPKRKRKEEDMSTKFGALDSPRSENFVETDAGSVLEEADLAEPESEDDQESVLSVDLEIGSNDAFDAHFGPANGSKLREYIRKAESGDLHLFTTRLEGLWKVVSVGSNDVHRRSRARIPKSLSALDLGIKQKLQSKGSKVIAGVAGIESYFAELLFDYADILFTLQERSNSASLLQLSCLHALNHIIKARDRVLKNNQKAAQSDEVQDDQFCDQGFTRPKVLFLLPTRQACYRAVTSMVTLYNPEQQENRKRFQDAFKGQDEAVSESKPPDFQDLFAGNDDDMFRVGLKFTRKTAKFFAPFYSSDVIFASPLGLRTAIGDEDSQKRDYDYLSSIELVIVDHADALMMQNWEHIEFIFEHLNLQPREAHGCDFSRVRPWYLDGQATYVRQTVLLTAFNTPEVNSLFNLKLNNFDGKVKIGEAAHKGLIAAPNALFKQVFYRFDAAQPASEPDARFQYFTTKLVPQLIKRARNEPRQAHGVLIFINSYMDFVRVRNFFANSTTTRDISFASLSEYAPAPEVARARSHFMSGKHSMLLYTSRIHHFRRYQLKGTKQVIFYSLPDNPIFWREIAAEFPARSVAAGKADAVEVTVQALFSKWDALRLERIVGTERLKHLLTETTGDIFEFIP